MPPIIITLRGVERCGALESRIREIAGRLLQYNDRIRRCHVTLVRGVAPNQDTVAARIHVSVPGAQIHADSADSRRGTHTDPFLALRDAYDGARHQLRELQKDGRKSSLADAARNLAIR